MLIRDGGIPELLLRAGIAAAETLREASLSAVAGATTGSIDLLVAERLAALGARSGPRLVYGFPGSLSASVNNEAAHAPPGARVLAAGDLVNLDLSVELGGYYADCALPIVVGGEGEGSSEGPARRLAAAALEVLAIAIAELRASMTARELGRLIEVEAARRGFVTLLGLGGHGVGRAPHEAPDHLPCHDDPAATAVFEEGRVLAIEVFLSSSDRLTRVAEDGWTLVTAPGNLVAQAERSVVVRRGPPKILT